MLVLSRKVGETVLIGDGIKVTVVKVEGGRVRLGVEAHENTRILRAELEGWREVPLEDSKHLIGSIT